MAYQTLYRKYRPKSFELVYGQDTIVKTLKNVIKKDKLSHAYLFTGPRGTGKTSCAKLFAKAINCLNNNDGDVCNNCDSCATFNENSNPDIIEIDAASNNGVDEIREIRNKVNLVPSFSKYKVYIIDEVHMLSIGAFNALLKTLEEPPKYIIFILATTEPQKLPTTVISRCQRFDFKSISKQKMKDCLKNIVEKEKISINEEALEEIINNSKGGMRDAIGMLDQAFAFCDEKITVKDVQELSGTISETEISSFFEAMLNKEYKKMLEKIKSWFSAGKDLVLISQKLINYVREGILYKKKIDINELNDFSFFDTCSEKKLYMIIDSLTETLNKMQLTDQKELVFEVQAIKMIDDLDINVSRETLNKEVSKVQELKKEEKTYEVVDFGLSELYIKIDELKNIRINNILKTSSREELKFLIDMWQNISEFLTDEKYKSVAGTLLEAKPVAASNKGIIITLPAETLLAKIEKNYDISKDLISNISNNIYKIVYITDSYWQEIRPKYVDLVRNNMLEIKDEEYLLSQINKIKSMNSVNEFDDLIEMEEK